MIKMYCDRCGKETVSTKRIQIPKQKTRYGFEVDGKEVCSGCEREYDEIISKLTDIRFVLFEGFMDKYKTEESK